jgi:hypothetical protein
MESQHRFPQSLENARAFSHISTARLRLHSLSKKGIIVDREREKCLTLINRLITIRAYSFLSVVACLLPNFFISMLGGRAKPETIPAYPRT